jgi:hypothetical protein
MAVWGFVISVRCRKVPAGLAKVPTWILSSSRRSSGHVPPQAFSAIRQEECQPAEDNVGADPVFPPVPDGAQVLVASVPGQRGDRFGGPGPEFLPMRRVFPVLISWGAGCRRASPPGCRSRRG